MRRANATWRTRLFNGAGRVVGAGLVIPANRLLTCAHVAAAAAGASRIPETAPEGQLTFGFSGLPDPSSAGLRVRATVSGWWPVEDCALLEIRGEVPVEVVPASLHGRDPVPGTLVRTFGHPRGLDDGVWSRARIVGQGGRHPSWIQFDAQDGVGRPIEPGFSGAAVMDDEGEVLGMVVALDGDRQYRVAWMASAVRLRELAGAGGMVAPAQRREADWQTKLEIAEALYEVPTMRSQESRQEIISLLPIDVASTIRRSSMTRMELFNLVQTCLNHDGSLSILVQVLDRFEGADSGPVRRLKRTIREHGLDGA